MRIITCFEHLLDYMIFTTLSLLIRKFKCLSNCLIQTFVRHINVLKLCNTVLFIEIITVDVIKSKLIVNQVNYCAINDMTN